MGENLNHARPLPPPEVFEAGLAPGEPIERVFAAWSDPATRHADDDADRLARLIELVHADLERLAGACVAGMRAYPAARARAGEALVADPERAIAFLAKLSADQTAAILREIEVADPVLAAELLRAVNSRMPAHALALYDTVHQALRGGVSSYRSGDVARGYNSIDGIVLSRPRVQTPRTYKFLR